MGIVSDIIGSFYSAGFYNHVARARRGIGMKFIFALTLIAVLLITGFSCFTPAR